MWLLHHAGLHNKTIHAKLWRFAWKDIPTTKEDRIEWLYRRWADMDAWVAEQKAREGASPSVRRKSE
jgi:hypothetical protein